MKLKKEDLKEFLEEKVILYNRLEFIETDPISIPHLYTKKEDIEIAGFLAAVIAWGNRKMILRNAMRILAYLGNSPHDFILNHREDDLDRIEGVIHRTMNATDLIYFIKALKHIYARRDGLESIFAEYQTGDSLQPAIHKFKGLFFELPHPERTVKHLPDPLNGSAAKRINMFLRIIKVA